MKFEIIHKNQNCIINVVEKEIVDGIAYFDFCLNAEVAFIPEPISVRFEVPTVEEYSVWSPSLGFSRHLGPDWSKRRTSSRLASGMPLHSLLSLDGKNRMTVALSDAIVPTSIGTGIYEENACTRWDISFFTIKISPIKEYRATIRIDTRDIAYYDSIYDVVSWWEEECGYAPAYVPEHAKLPMNSLWYTYHQQLDVEDILKECKLSKEIGMETVIIDDGWQTDDNSRGYAFCGDWELATKKIPSMKKFVEDIHQIGMKVMLWYSVPFVGLYAKNYDRFKDMLLAETGNNRDYWSLDPRYKEVRDFLVQTYSNALIEWKLDGLKLDFIDSFALKGMSLEPDPRRDYESLEEAIDVLMTDITKALTAINSEVLIEFRQSYVGPAIRKYGNMLRVADCPNDAIANRLGSVNLRLTSGNTAVHSDMIMWHYDDTVESAALQFSNILYAVPQISVKLAKLKPDHKKMLEYYISFWREHRDILTEGKLLAASPESAYSLVCAQKDGKAVFTAYTDTVIDCKKYSYVVAVNSTRYNWLIVKNAIGRSYKIVDCMGNKIEEGNVDSNLSEINVPLSGMIFVN